MFENAAEFIADWFTEEANGHTLETGYTYVFFFSYIHFVLNCKKRLTGGYGNKLADTWPVVVLLSHSAGSNAMHFEFFHAICVWHIVKRREWSGHIAVLQVGGC